MSVEKNIEAFLRLDLPGRKVVASSVPIAAYPVTGPIDALGGTDAGVIDNDLEQAALAALKLDPKRCREHALSYSWARSARQFVDNIVKAHRPPLQKAA